MRIRMMMVAALAAVSLAACGSKPKQDTTGGGGGGTTASLYDRLGKQDSIKAVVDQFVANVAADTRINAAFANADIPHLKQMLVDQICAAAGGPCKYTGKDMKTAHQGMNIKAADFDALVEDLVKALDAYHVGAKEKQDLLGALGPMKGDIVTAQ